MKIIELRAENIKRLVAVSIRPDGNVVEITGKNGAGKTSVLDAIWWALEGRENIQSAPIRKGQSEAKITLDLGEMKVTRNFKAAEGGFTTSILVEQANGARFPKPQAVLDSLLGRLSLDPLEFSRMDAKQQFETMKSFVPGVDFDALAKADKADYDTRTDINRRAKELRAQAGGIQVPATLPAHVDEAALVDEMQKAGEHNADIEKRKAARERAAEEIKGRREKADEIERDGAVTVKRETEQHARSIKELERQIKALQDRIANEQATHAEYLASAVPSYTQKAEEQRTAAAELATRLKAAGLLPEPIDVSGIRTKMADARAANETIARSEQRRKLEGEAKALEERSKTLTKAMEDRAAAKQDAIAAAQMPVSGIEFGDGEILLNGIPFDQASDAEKLRCSIAIAAAMNPKLRVIRVRDGSLLDSDARQILAAFAAEHDQQIWIETVQSDSKNAVLIVDGMVAEQEKAA